VNQQSAAVILGLLLLAPAAPVAAQPPADLPQALGQVAPSETVTIMDADGRRLAGRVAEVSSGGLTLVQQGQALSVPLQRVARVTIADSNRNGTVIGALVGAAIGAAGGLALNAICTNEGGDCFGIMLALTGTGAASGAGIGWLGDRLHQSVVYAVPGAPREFASEVGVRVTSSSGGGTTVPGVGGSWGVTSHAGLGFEVNVDRSMGRDGNGRGTSFDGRMLYVFGKGRYRPYGLVGAGYFESFRAYNLFVPEMGPFPAHVNEGQYRAHGVAPLAGGGVRVAVTPKISLRPEVIWYAEPDAGGRSGLRASVGAGFGW